MTQILALDTSADACSVALLRDGEIDELFELAPRDHTRLILPMVEQLLQRNDCDLAQLDAIAFGRGPGSFTGLRICAGVVQGLAFGAGLPVVAVSSLAAVAQAHFERTPQEAGIALVCMDARMGELYFAGYGCEGVYARLQGRELLLTPAALPLDKWLATGGTLHGIGSGWACLEQMRAVRSDFASIDEDALPRARHIAQLAERSYGAGELLQAQEAEPVYLREQVAWNKTGST